jgi:oxygen-independent coproporphyrinogen III oxidase
MLSQTELLHKYNTQVPRYTSYPTVPFWKEMSASQQWKETFQQNFHQQNLRQGISLYLHLPFCESLCTYCGCNKKITTNHGVEEEYINIILKEWQMYRQLMDEEPVIRELHLGGGTPTFFSPQNLQRLVEGIFESAIIHPQHEFSLEGHPNNTTIEHLKTLYLLGFRRVSYGVQDNDPVVQKAINRIQPVANVRRATENARTVGYHSVNFDLIYGLPFQTLKGEAKTLDETIQLKPDRIAFYSYAHVPWKQKAQRLFDENDLPSPELKTQLYLLGKEKLGSAGYSDIGMDHFALPHDELYQSWKNGSLHRNFMGYTITHTSFLLGLGVSAISDFGTAYSQNHKELSVYFRLINESQYPINKGCFLSEPSEVFKRYILDTACKGKVTFKKEHYDLLLPYTIPRLRILAEDGLITLKKEGFKVNEQGRQYLRNICQAFDLEWWQSEARLEEQIFSRSV